MDALFALADTQIHILPLDEKQYAEGIQYLDEYVNARPKDEKALRLQMEVRTRDRNWADVIAVADLILQIQPSDKDVLWQKAEAQIQPPKPNYPAARATIEKLLTVAPRHIDALNRLAALKLKSGDPTTRVVADAEKLLTDHAGDAGFESAAAHALIYAASVDEANRVAWVARARDILNAAIARPPADAPTVFSLVTGLDETLRFKDAIDYLSRVAETFPDPAVELVLVRRLWEADQFQRVMDRASKSPAASPKTHSDALAFQVMSLRVLASDPKQAENRTRLLNQSDEIAAMLARRTNDVAARQWTALLKLESESAAAAGGAAAAAPATAPRPPAAPVEITPPSTGSAGLAAD
jgi:tetratricopeptide (TPR) repeat protein